MKKITSMADVLDLALAEEELGHRKKLKSVKTGWSALAREDAGDLGIAETIDDVKPHAHMDYRELVAFAIKKENTSHGLYSRLATIFTEPELQETFEALAREEAEHKRRFELEYESLTS
jgi:hypothetical protein